MRNCDDSFLDVTDERLISIKSVEGMNIILTCADLQELYIILIFLNCDFNSWNRPRVFYRCAALIYLIGKCLTFNMLR